MGKRLRILVVENDLHVRAFVIACAKRLGHDAQAVPESAQFMTMFVRFKPDVVIMDVVMPGIDGFELLQWLVDVDFTGRVVAMSGNPLYSKMLVALAEANARRMAAVVILDKPFKAEQLGEALAGGATQLATMPPASVWVH